MSWATPAIDLDSVVEIQFGPEPGQLPDLVQGEGDEFLPAKARIDAHHQHVMNHGQDFDQKIDPGGRVNHHGGFHAVLGYELQGAVQVAAGLVVDARSSWLPPRQTLR